MVRKKKARKRSYKEYYEKDARNPKFCIPGTTLASRSKKMRMRLNSTDHDENFELSPQRCSQYQDGESANTSGTVIQSRLSPAETNSSNENFELSPQRCQDGESVNTSGSETVMQSRLFPAETTFSNSSWNDSHTSVRWESIRRLHRIIGDGENCGDTGEAYNEAHEKEDSGSDQENLSGDDCSRSAANNDSESRCMTVRDCCNNFSSNHRGSFSDIDVSECLGCSGDEGGDNTEDGDDGGGFIDSSDNEGRDAGDSSFNEDSEDGEDSSDHGDGGDSSHNENSEDGTDSSDHGDGGDSSHNEDSEDGTDSSDHGDSSHNEDSEDGTDSSDHGDGGDSSHNEDSEDGADSSDHGDGGDSSHNEDDCGSESDASNDEDGEEYPDAFRRLKSELQGAFQNPINMQVRITVGEILTNALALSKKHNWNHSETADVLKFASSILRLGNALPDSRYMVDAYFYSKKGMEYHFYCSECSHYLGKVPSHLDVRASQVICPNANCKHINETGNLAEASYFVTFDLRGQIETLLSDPKICSKLMNPVDFVEEPADGIMTDLHHGSSYRKFACFVRDSPTTANCKVLSLTLAVDSATLSHFSKLAFCPCFIGINELPPVIRMGNLLIAGLWFGIKKEIMDVFLPPIVEHIVHLSMHGFSVTVGAEVWVIKAFLTTSVADSVARCEVQGLHSHRGDFPCNWCHIEGEEFDNVRIFRYADPSAPPRTTETLFDDANEAIRRKEFIHGVKYLCLLSPAPMFHPVEGFIVDQMHAKDEGITKMFLKAWLGEGNQPYSIGSAPNMKKMKILMKKIKLPKECRKNIRGLDVIAFWTAREFENFEFFISIPLLVDILPVGYLKHFAMYVQGCYILLNSEVPITAVPVANQLLQDFRRDVEALYSPYMMTFNMHILEHFAQNTERHGPMFALSAYAFEAGIQRIKKMVHAGNYIPSQICRSLSEEDALLLLKKNCETPVTVNFEKKINRKLHVKEIKVIENVELLGLNKNYRLSLEERFLFSHRELLVDGWEEYMYLKKEGCHYGPSRGRKFKTDNSFARLTSYQLIHIKRVLYNEDLKQIVVVASRVRCRPSRFCPPAVIRYNANLCFQYLVDAIDEDVELYDVSQLATICVSLPFSHGHFLSPMPNIFNMF